MISTDVVQLNYHLFNEKNKQQIFQVNDHERVTKEKKRPLRDELSTTGDKRYSKNFI